MGGTCIVCVVVVSWSLPRRPLVAAKEEEGSVTTQEEPKVVGRYHLVDI